MLSDDRRPWSNRILLFLYPHICKGRLFRGLFCHTAIISLPGFLKNSFLKNSFLKIRYWHYNCSLRNHCCHCSCSLKIHYLHYYYSYCHCNLMFYCCNSESLPYCQPPLYGAVDSMAFLLYFMQTNQYVFLTLSRYLRYR